MARGLTFRKKRNNRLGMLCVGVVVFTLCAVLLFSMLSLYKKRADYNDRIELLNSQIDDEKKRTEELEEYEKYTKTSAYVEEVAKDRLGLVYSDEIIFQPEE